MDTPPQASPGRHGWDSIPGTAGLASAARFGKGMSRVAISAGWVSPCERHCVAGPRRDGHARHAGIPRLPTQHRLVFFLLSFPPLPLPSSLPRLYFVSSIIHLQISGPFQSRPSKSKASVLPTYPAAANSTAGYHPLRPVLFPVWFAPKPWPAINTWGDCRSGTIEVFCLACTRALGCAMK